MPVLAVRSGRPVEIYTIGFTQTTAERTGSWADYEEDFFGLRRERGIESVLSAGDCDGRTALLYSEAAADRWHRRLLCEYLAEAWPSIGEIHL